MRNKMEQGIEDIEIYDLYMSVGIACRPAMQLVKNDLRFESAPLDWQMSYSLDTVIHLFNTKFDDFFSSIIEDEKREDEIENRWIIDTKNHIISIHHFPKSIEASKSQNPFIIKMKKRYEKLDHRLRESKRIVIVSNRTNSINSFQQFLEQFSNIYPHLIIKHINIRNDEKMSSQLYEKLNYIVSNKISIEEYCFNDTYDSITGEKFSPSGNDEIWQQILRRYYVRRYYEEWSSFKKKHKNIIVYGAGKRCRELIDKFDKYGIRINGIAVANEKTNPSMINQYCVRQIDKFNCENEVIISLSDKKESKQIKKHLLEKGYRRVMYTDSNLMISDSINN